MPPIEHKPGDGFFCWCANGERHFKFHDLAGEVLFTKVRVSVDEAAHGRDKAMRYRCLPCWRVNRPDWHKPDGADELLYGLDQDLTGTVWFPEGEKDADSLRAIGLVAVAHHQAAGNPMTVAQAQWLRKAKKVVIVADRDLPGSFLAFSHARHLLGLGINAKVVWPAAGKDATEHLEAGFGRRDFVKADVATLAQEAAAFKASGISYIPKSNYQVTHEPGRIIVRRLKETSRG